MTPCPFFLRDCTPYCLDYAYPDPCKMIARFHRYGAEYIAGLKDKAPEFKSGQLIAVRAGDPILSSYGWTEKDFAGHLVIDGQTIWMSSIWSKHPGTGNFSRLVKNLRGAGYTLIAFGPFQRMELILQHKGFTKTVRFVPELNESMALYTLSRTREGLER